MAEPVTNALRLLKLPKSVQELVLDRTLSMGHARALLALEDDARIVEAATKTVEEGLSVRQTERMVTDLKNGPATEPKKRPKKVKPEETQAEKDVRMRLQRALGTKCDLKHRDGRGTVVVHFGSFDELEALMERMGA